METSILLLIIALAVAVGCYIGQKHIIETYRISQQFPRDYFIGLNYVLNEQPDKALDIFTKLLQIDNETIETHLALGNLFRRRGEVERAIRIHQNLIARPQLAKQQRIEALFALGKDYLHAGLIDRAERLFLEIVEMGEQLDISLHYLLEIFQRQKKWQEAITVAHQLKAISKEPLHIIIAHYHCELAQTLLQKHEIDAAYHELRNALKIDLQCARANQMLGDIERQLKKYKQAMHFYKQIRDQDKDCFLLSLPALVQCYEMLNDKEKLISYLEESLLKIPVIEIALLLTSFFEKMKNDQTAINFLTAYLNRYPSLEGLQYLINLQQKSSHTLEKEDLLILKNLVLSLLKNRFRYRCTQCGFKSINLLWLCPGCRTWGRIKSVQDN